MLTYCYQACTGCYSPSRIGTSAVPGLTLVDTAAKTLILPYKFSNFSIITQFSGFFTTTNPIHLQLWRPNGTVANSFNLIYDQRLVPTAANQTQTILLDWCVVAQANDQIGFSSLAGPASLGYVLDATQTFYETYMKDVTSPGPFTPSFLSYYFSLSAQFVSGTSCNSV
jgi:aminopeptidase N